MPDFYNLKDSFRFISVKLGVNKTTLCPNLFFLPDIRADLVAQPDGLQIYHARYGCHIRSVMLFSSIRLGAMISPGMMRSAGIFCPIKTGQKEIHFMLCQKLFQGVASLP